MSESHHGAGCGGGFATQCPVWGNALRRSDRLDTPSLDRYAYQIVETTKLWCRKILERLGRRGVERGGDVLT